MRLQKALLVLTLMMLAYAIPAPATEDDAASVRSVHFGFVHPAGVDLAGYSVEKKFSPKVYFFYTFGIPSFAAMGLSYYQEYDGDGLTATGGAGIGFVLYGAVAYQWRSGKQNYIKLGAGVAAGVAYSGAIPVLSYEHRFAP